MVWLRFADGSEVTVGAGAATIIRPGDGAESFHDDYRSNYPEAENVGPEEPAQTDTFTDVDVDVERNDGGIEPT